MRVQILCAVVICVLAYLVAIAALNTIFQFGWFG